MNDKKEKEMKEYCIYCGKERRKKVLTGFFSRRTGKKTYNLVCSNKECTKEKRLKQLRVI